MYEEFFGLREKPFQNTPDPKFIYYSQEYEEALSRLLYTIDEQMGAAMLTGIFGCGKTMIAYALMEKLADRGDCKVAYVANPQLSDVELLRMVAYYLGVQDLPQKKSEILKDYILEKIEEILHNNYDDGKNTVLIIDEAHVIKDLVIFEELRLLLNFQLKERFLLTLILSGQPELKKNIDNVKQLSQRIALRAHIDKLSEENTKNYIRHRLKVAGQEKMLFSNDALKLVFERSGGIPRRINNICEISLVTSFGKGLNLVNAETIEEVAKDLESQG